MTATRDDINVRPGVPAILLISSSVQPNTMRPRIRIQCSNSSKELLVFAVANSDATCIVNFDVDEASKMHPLFSSSFLIATLMGPRNFVTHIFFALIACLTHHYSRSVTIISPPPHRIYLLLAHKMSQNSSKLRKSLSGYFGFWIAPAGCWAMSVHSLHQYYIAQCRILQNALSSFLFRKHQNL